MKLPRVIALTSLLGCRETHTPSALLVHHVDGGSALTVPVHAPSREDAATRVDAGHDAGRADAASGDVTSPPGAPSGCRRDLPPPATLFLGEEPSHLPLITADASPPLVEACTRLAARTEAIYRGIPQVDGGAIDFDTPGLGHCQPAGRGAWALELRSLRPASTPESPDHLAGRWRLVYFDHEGRSHPAPVEGAIDWELLDFTGPTIDWVLDLDRDGVGEVHVSLVTNDLESHTTHASWAMHTVGSTVGAFAPVAGFATDRPSDVDADGIVDFVVDAPYHFHTIGYVDRMLAAITMLAHGRPDGTWSQDDAIAQDYVRQECAAKSTTPPFLRNLDSDSRTNTLGARLSCARFLGVSSDAIARSIQAEWRDMGLDAGDPVIYGPTDLPGTLNELRAEPSFRVDPRCP